MNNKLFALALLGGSLLSGFATTVLANELPILNPVEPGKALAAGEQYHQAPAWNEFADPHFGEAVKRGYSIFMNSQQEAPAGFVNNGLNCTNCHLFGGRVENSAPMWGAYVAYPAWRGKNKKVNTYADRLQGCFMYSMNAKNAKAPEAVSQTILDLTAYSYWLATNAQVSASLPGRGFPKMATKMSIDTAKIPAEFARGKTVYAQQCAFCHGQNGEGQLVKDRYVFPPLWGKASYNWGAGMHQISSAANFIKANMPLSKGYSLTDQQAWDVSVFINSHERPQDPRKKQASVAETTKVFHAKDSLYGQPSALDQHILGSQAF